MSIIKYTVAFTALMLSACQHEAMDDSNTTTMQHDHSEHQHVTADVAGFGSIENVPTVAFTAEADSMTGWNIHIVPTHFKFTPENVNKDISASEGHAHIMVDGYKMARVYSNWYHLKTLTPGEHEITVTLNANNHAVWQHQGQEISATVTVVQN